jgi:predicted glycosyltransferase
VIDDSMRTAPSSHDGPVPSVLGSLRITEQLRRARRLEALGAVTVLDATALSPRGLVDAVRVARAGSPSQVSLRLDGARCTTDLIASLLAR